MRHTALLLLASLAVFSGVALHLHQTQMSGRMSYQVSLTGYVCPDPASALTFRPGKTDRKNSEPVCRHVTGLIAIDAKVLATDDETGTAAPFLFVEEYDEMGRKEVYEVFVPVTSDLRMRRLRPVNLTYRRDKGGVKIFYTYSGPSFGQFSTH